MAAHPKLYTGVIQRRSGQGCGKLHVQFLRVFVVRCRGLFPEIGYVFVKICEPGQPPEGGIRKAAADRDRRC